MRWKVLAGLRFFLAWVVVCEHLKVYIPDANNNVFLIFSKLNALTAVFVFIFLSGYSIAHSVNKNPEGFYRRRIFRIYPLYFCAVIFSLIPFWVLGSTIEMSKGNVPQPELFTVAGNFVFLQTFLVGNMASNPPLWTLGVEVFAYIVAPLFIKLNNKAWIAIIGLSATLYATYPYFYKFIYPNLNRVPHPASNDYGISFIILLWAWLLGALYFREGDKLYSKIMLIAVGCLVLLLNQNYTGKVAIFTYTVSCLILIFSDRIKLPKAVLDIFNYLGDLSYPLYLFHVPTIIFGYAALGIKNSTTLAFLSLVISMLFYHVVELPLRPKRKTAVSG